ncbi:HutD family protein [Luteibacter anthropi]|uniref:HutD/Ves family protein n=1 Tax=Luteibacter anthropi TaxID=564369 RepID=UPI0020328D9C|nr:HutD family protein [Luteibacter anthropi]URX63392.1 HutD family protein [Luteibacter anthropi]
MKIIRFDELKAVPWKNGLGITREIAVIPEGAGMDDFLWRVSIADVDTASPFSTFPGIDRTIVLLEGDGFTMTLDGEREHALTVPCEPFSFAGEAKVEVRLAGGATRDFNLMVRRGKARGEVRALRGEADVSRATLVYLSSGHGTADGEPVVAGDTVFEATSLQLSADATALVVTLTL